MLSMLRCLELKLSLSLDCIMVDANTSVAHRVGSVGGIQLLSLGLLPLKNAGLFIQTGFLAREDIPEL